MWLGYREKKKKMWQLVTATHYACMPTKFSQFVVNFQNGHFQPDRKEKGIPAKRAKCDPSNDLGAQEQN